MAHAHASAQVQALEGGQRQRVHSHIGAQSRLRHAQEDSGAIGEPVQQRLQLPVRDTQRRALLAQVALEAAVLHALNGRLRPQTARALVHARVD